MFGGCRDSPTTVPPESLTTVAAAFSSDCPNEKSAVRKYQRLSPFLTIADAVPRASATVSYA